MGRGVRGLSSARRIQIRIRSDSSSALPAINNGRACFASATPFFFPCHTNSRGTHRCLQHLRRPFNGMAVTRLILSSKSFTTLCSSSNSNSNDNHSNQRMRTPHRPHQQSKSKSLSLLYPVTILAVDMTAKCSICIMDPQRQECQRTIPSR